MFPQIFGKYVLERELASGGMARVYLATLRGAVGFEKRLVLKQIRPELSLDDGFVRRFVDEAKIAVELSHPNIVPVYELGVEAGVYYIAMELCEGLTLTEVLGDTGPLDAAEGAYLGNEICRALDYAHRKGGIVHRDVTPRNVLLDEEGAVRLIDFGIAAPATTEGSARVEVFGSPGHMPPEQIRGEHLTAATDVFAVGVLLIEAWTGRPPFRRESFEASAEALKEPVPSLALEYPELAPVAETVARALSLRVSERPPDAEAFGRKLREFSRQFDSGDVAKRLGARVQRARRGPPSSSPWLSGEGSGPLTPAATPQALLSSHPPPKTPATPPMPPLTPATPPGAGPITRTFAASPNLMEWTRRVASAPPSSPSGDAEAEEASEPNSLVSSSPPLIDASPESDNLATRRLPSAPPQRSSVSRWAIGAGLAVVALVALAMAGKAQAPRPPTATPAPIHADAPPPALPLAAPLAPATAPPPSAAAPPSLPPSAIPASPGPSGPPPRTAPHLAPSGATSPSRPGADNAPSGESALLRLTADPEATVTVLGGRSSQTQVTPVRALKLAPGAYTVTFRSATFGEPVVARVELAGGASRSVHADFRAAIPTVVVR